MNDDISPANPGKSGLGRKLGLALAGLVLLLVVLYFVVSSGAFLKALHSPASGQGDEHGHYGGRRLAQPLSQLTLDKLKVQAPGAEPLLTAEQVRVRYRLFSILGGNYVVDELTLSSPIIQVVKEANGNSNLDPLTKKVARLPPVPGSESPLRLAVRNLAIKDGTLVSTEKAADGGDEADRIRPTSTSRSTGVENGQSGKATLGSALKMEQRVAPGKGGTNDFMEGKVEGGFDFKLDEKLLPQTVSGKATLALPRAEGAYTDLAGLGAVLQAEMSPTEVKQLALRFERAAGPWAGPGERSGGFSQG